METLKNIEDRLILIENKYPDNIVALFPKYLHALQNVLFPAIKQQKKLLTHANVSPSQPASAEFTNFIEGLSPNSFSDLLQLFTKKYKNDFELDEALDKLTEKYPALEYLVDNYTLKYIGGGNGKVLLLDMG